MVAEAGTFGISDKIEWELKRKEVWWEGVGKCLYISSSLVILGLQRSRKAISRPNRRALLATQPSCPNEASRATARRTAFKFSSVSSSFT